MSIIAAGYGLRWMSSAMAVSVHVPLAGKFMIDTSKYDYVMNRL